MRWRRGCGLVAFGLLTVVIACLVCLALAWGLVLTGEISLYPPRVADIEPERGYSFRPTTPITITYDRPMEPASAEASFALNPAVLGRILWNEAQTQMVFVPEGEGYKLDTEYTLHLLPGAKEALLPRRSEHTVERHFALPPLLEAATALDQEESAGPWPVFSATYNYRLDCDATLQSFTSMPEAEGRLDCDGHTLAFSPTLPLEPNTGYTFELENVFLEGDDRPRPGLRWDLKTALPLAVVDAAPVDGESLTDLWTPVRIAFNRPVVAASVQDRFTLSDDIGELVPGQVSWEDGGATFVFQPQAALRPEAAYRLSLESGVRDEMGFVLAEGRSHAFETEPMLAEVLPQHGAKSVPMTQEISISFTRPMDQASVESGLVFTPALQGEAVWEGATVRFVPETGLDPRTQYDVLLEPGILDASGAPLAQSHRWAFKTEPFLLGADVFVGQIEDLQAPLEFAFAQPMNRASVEAALVIAPETPGEFAWRDGDRIVAFQPEPGWLTGVDYEIVLDTSARTADGHHRPAEAMAWRFATAPSEVQFGEGPNVQVMDVEGERLFQVTFRGADVAEFRLYPITPTQFLELYSSGFRGIGPDETQILDTGALTPAVTWREPLVPLDEPRYDDWRAGEASLPANVPQGMYVLALASPAMDGEGQGNDHLLVVLTSHALVLKQALAGSAASGGAEGQSAGPQAQILTWDTELSGGAPVVSSTVRLYDRDGTFLADGKTDADGLLALDVSGDPAPLLALAEKDGDVTVSGLSNEWSQDGWWWWWTEPPSRPLYTVYAYTDRPIYRPGQTVYFKDWIRADGDVSYTLPAPDLPVTVRLRDARDNVAFSQVLTPTQFGSVYGEFQLADEPVLGTWNLETEVDGAISRQPLKVEEYRKPEYEVAVSTAQSIYVQGEPISVTVDAQYYFGQPVSGAGVELVVYLSYPEEAYFYAEEGPAFGYPLLSESGRTDAEGRWTVTVLSDDIIYEGSHAPQVRLALEATVSDDSGRSVSSYETAVVRRTSQGLSLLLEQHGYAPGEEVQFSAQVRDRDLAPLGGVKVVAQTLGWDGQEVASATATTDDSGLAHFSVSLAEQGWYEIQVSGLDDGDREMQAGDYVWVYDPSGQAAWYRGQWGDEPDLTVSADRTTYQTGETAQVLVYTGVSGPALLTFERGETQHAQPISLVSGTNLITVPVRVEYAPNIDVTVSQFGPVDPNRWMEYGRRSHPEAELHVASVQIQVPMTDRLLSVTLTSDQETYAAGDEATFEVQVTDHGGRPVVAEVSLAVVDEAIYALAEDMSRDPFEVFYAPRPNVVRSYDSLKPTRWLYPEGPGLGGGDGDGAAAPRRDFQDTAYWAPTVVTGEDGRATITFALPDNLTEWRALARAVTTDTLVGRASTGVIVSQDIVVQPVLPRFLVQGDAIRLTAVVHNFTAQPVSATVALEVDGLTLVDGDTVSSRVVHVPAGGSTVAGWPVGAREAGEATVNVQTVATRGARLIGRDAVELSLPVYPLAVPEVATFAGQLTPARPTATLTITLPSDAIEGISRLEISLAPSVAPGLLQGLEYLIDYPFG